MVSVGKRHFHTFTFFTYSDETKARQTSHSSARHACRKVGYGGLSGSGLDHAYCQMVKFPVIFFVWGCLEKGYHT